MIIYFPALLICPAMPCPGMYSLLSLIIPCPSLLCFVHPVLSFPAFKCSALSCPDLPCPDLPSLVQPWSALQSGLVPLCPSSLCSILSCLELPSSLPVSLFPPDVLFFHLSPSCFRSNFPPLQPTLLTFHSRFHSLHCSHQDHGTNGCFLSVWTIGECELKSVWFWTSGSNWGQIGGLPTSPNCAMKQIHSTRVLQQLMCLLDILLLF